MNRLAAMQLWPLLIMREVAQASTVGSKSASSKIT
jgi:hypothetical protein